LHEAAAGGWLGCVRVLVENDGGARVDLRKSSDWTPLMLAVEHGHVDVARLLVRQGADWMGARNKEGSTAVMLAARAGSVPMLGVFAEQPGFACAVQDATYNGRTALHTACYHGRDDVVSWLLNWGAEPSPRDSSGATPLHDAAGRGHLSCVKVLFETTEAQQLLTVVDCLGLSALHYAAMRGHNSVVEEIVSRSTLNEALILDKRGRSARDLALSNGHRETGLVFELRGLLL